MADLQPLSTLFCFFGTFVVLTALMMAASMRIVPEYRRLLVYRLGREIGEKGPGLVLLIPIIDRGVVVDVGDQAARAQAALERYGALGETQTYVDDREGAVTFEGRTWGARSRETLPPGTRVRVTRVILEVERVQAENKLEQSDA
jgi:membrane protein implicated in regulation of membrane protease activity